MSKIIGFFKKFFNKSVITNDFEEILVEDCMIFRSQIPIIYLEDTVEEIKQVISEHNQRFILICDESADDIIGVLDIFSIDLFNNFDIKNQKLLEPSFVASNTDISTIIVEILQEKSLYVVIDEFGGTKGIVNINSLMHYVLDSFQYQKLEKSESIDIHGSMSLDNLQKIIEIKDVEEYDSKTVGGFIIEYLGKIPQINEVFEIENVQFVILSAENRQIQKIKLTML